jgi:hypothetical protein
MAATDSHPGYCLELHDRGDDALMSAIGALRCQLVGAGNACEAIGLFLVIVDLAARSGSVGENDLEHYAGDLTTRQDALYALQSAGLIYIRQASDISGTGFEITVTGPHVLEGWRHDVA